MEGVRGRREGGYRQGEERGGTVTYLSLSAADSNVHTLAQTQIGHRCKFTGASRARSPPHTFKKKNTDPRLSCLLGVPGRKGGNLTALATATENC